MQASLAVEAGVCIDLFVVSSLEYVDLASLKFLSICTGGNLMYYDTASTASLPQDVFRQLQKPQVMTAARNTCVSQQGPFSKHHLISTPSGVRLHDAHPDIV